MTHRQPVPDSRPSCFGIGYVKHAQDCAACPVQRTCHAEMAAGATTVSLSQELAAAWRATEQASHTDSPEDIFAAVWQAHYGFNPWGKHMYRQHQRGQDAQRKALPKAVTVCQQHDLDLGVFITAQIHAFEVTKKKGWLKYAPTYMPITWLSGPKAIERYHTYGYIANKLYHGVQAHTLDGHTALGALREALVQGEERMAEEYCERVRAGEDPEWVRLITALNINKDWRAVNERTASKLHGIRQHYRDLCKRYGDAMLDREQRLATLRVAFALAEAAQHGLPDRIGITEWSWASCARLLARVQGPVPTVTRRPMVAPQLGGHLWGVHDTQPREGDMKRYGEN